MFITAEDGQRIVCEIKQTIGRDVNIMDQTGTIIASTDAKRIGQLHTIAQRIIRENLPMLEVHQPGPNGIQEGINLPIHVNGTCEGVIGITGPVEAVRDFGTITKKMTEILLATIRQQEQQNILERARNQFVEEWIFSDSIDWSAFAIRGKLLQIDIDQPWQVGLLEYAETGSGTPASEMHSSRYLQMLRQHLRQDPDALWSIVNRRILFLFSGKQPDQAIRIFRKIHYDSTVLWNIPLGGGLSSVCRSAEDLRRCYQEAKIAVHSAVQDRSVRTYSSASLEFIVHNIDPKIKQDVCNTIFPPMRDAEYQELLACLRLYFQCDGNIEKAAELSCIHKNTFRYRMNKITQLTGYDLRSPRDSVLLYLFLQFSDSLNT